MRVIILCQGQQERMGGQLACPKQLLQVAGETILGRTVRLLRQLDQHDMFVIANFYVPDLGVTTLAMPEPCYCILQRIHQTQELWHPVRTLFLLGDVIWSKLALKSVVDDQHWLTFAGEPDHGDLFSVAWDGDMNGRVLAVLPQACGWNKHERSQPGHLRLLQGQFDSVKYVTIDDYTRDVDNFDDLTSITPLEALIAAEKD